MKTYILTTPKDAHGQPIRMFRFNYENNVSKSIDQLSGICRGILADGIVTEAEAKFFAEWVQTNAAYEPCWPFADIIARVNKIMADGQIDDAEREELKGVMEAICGQESGASTIEATSTKLPLDDPAPTTIIFPNSVFSITGKFAFGPRKKVVQVIEERGGRASDSPPSSETNYLVVGLFASRDWLYTSYGRKIERAVELRSSGRPISIIAEEHWRRFVN